MSQIITLYKGSLSLALPSVPPVAAALDSQPVAGSFIPRHMLLSAAFRPTGTVDPANRVTVYVQTRLGDDEFYDIAAFEFADVGLTRIVNLTAATPITTPLTLTTGALAVNTAVDGILGREFKADVRVMGAYASGSMINVAAQLIA